MPTLRIDNRPVEVPAGATVLDAARALGIDIPTLCHFEGCKPQTSCLVCLVRVNGSQRLVPSCATVVAEGMSVESETDPVKHARRTAIELLLADHAGDCLAPCQTTCPAHMDIPRMIQQISAGEFRDALITVKRHIALPAALGRICPDLCEKGCRRGAQDNPVSICKLKRFVADTDLASAEPYLPACREATGKRVAIVGAGPAGLAAAWYLQQLGHGCTIFDEHPLPGGNMRYAAGEDRLPHGVIDAEFGLIQRMGATFHPSMRIGGQMTLEDLRRDFDAVLIAVGVIDKPKAEALDVELAGHGIKADRHTMATTIPGVFAAGAVITPFRHAVRAVADGRGAAHAIDLFLRGLEPAGHRPAFSVRLGMLTGQELATLSAGSAPEGRNPGAKLQPLGDGEAVAESMRCFQCACSKQHDCRLRLVSIQYEASATRYKMPRRQLERGITHPAIVWEPGKCISCGLCVQIANRAGEPLGLTHIGRGFSMRIAAPFDGEMSQALQQAAEECARACPTAAITLRSEACLPCSSG